MNKKILYAEAIYDEDEKKAVMESLENNWLAAGPRVSEFEKEIAKLFNKKYAVATNSGSSANLLALTALGLTPGSEVITPACTFATTVAPIIQCGLKPVFIDVISGRYIINEEKIKKNINPFTKAIMVPQLVGGVANMRKLRQIADQNGLYLIDDSCDTIAPEYRNKPIATYSDITTTSFYGSHIITTMGSGGMVLTDNKDILERLKSLVNWGRVGSDNEDFKERFDYTLDNIPYDSKFIYSHIGFNFKMTEGQAAFGLAQLKKLPYFIEIRKKNYFKLIEYFQKYADWFQLPYVLPEYSTTWLAFPLTIRSKAPFKRYDLLKHLDKYNIQVRILFAGNITRHPAYSGKEFNYLKKHNLPESDKIMRNGFLVGCHQGLTDDNIDYMISIFEKFLCKQL